MASTLNSSSWPAFTQASLSNDADSSPSIYLDFLTSIAACDIAVFDKTSIGRSNPIVGSGGFATVERVDSRNVGIWRDFPAFCVMKKSRATLANGEECERILRHNYLEVRILSHEPLRRHPHVIDILGICMDAELQYPSFSIVLEYTPHGNLKSFLKEHCEEIEEYTLMALSAQVANGLEAIHASKICHGDVKAENVLAFQVDGMWTAKITDFNSSIVGTPNNLAAPVRSVFGTRLRNAPEVRRMTTFDSLHRDIDAAILTDVYSFGLLTWEIMKKGQPYFDSRWCGLRPNEVNEDSMEKYLNTLPVNGLLLHAQNFLEETIACADTGLRVSAVFISCLQDDPKERLAIVHLRQILQDTSTGFKELERSVHIESEHLLELASWNTRNSLLEILGAFRAEPAAGHLISVSSLPATMRVNIVEQMKQMACSVTVSDESRSHAALCVAECHVIGFGTTIDQKEVLRWVLKAANLSSEKAMSWYPRLCSAMRSSPESTRTTSQFLNFEDKLTDCLTTEYLMSRIRLQRYVLVEQLKTHLVELPRPLLGVSEYSMATVRLFNSWNPNHLLPIDVAALIGDEEATSHLLHDSGSDSSFPKGCTAAHYACIGGNLSALKLILSHRPESSQSLFHGATLLHFCIFFDDSDVTEAVEVLLSRGVDPANQSTNQPIIWEYHDIHLSGTALDWAILCRNRALVKALLPFTKDYTCLKTAVDCSFWEIVDDILKNFSVRTDVRKDLWYLHFEPRPFAHWIAHGADQDVAIKRTINLLMQYQHGFDQCFSPQEYDELEIPILLPGLSDEIVSEASLVHLETWIDLLPSKKLKQRLLLLEHEYGSEYETGLAQAINSATTHRLWASILRKLIGLYTIEELEAETTPQGSYLHAAISEGCVIGVRILLEKGVDVNQPTFDEGKETPLHLCLQRGQSVELYNILLEYGADPTAGRLSSLQITPYEGLFMSADYRPHAAIQALDGCKTSSQLANLIGNTFFMQLRGQNTAHREYFRLLLRSSRMTEHIDKANEYDATMLHVAAFSLDSESVNVLLEAGADAALRGGKGAESLLPLQIACLAGRALWSKLPTNPILVAQREEAMKVASSLLQWHHARSDGLFKGITKLHLACRMGIEAEAQTLVASGSDRNAKGSWPLVAHEVDAWQLHDLDLETLPELFPLDHEEHQKLRETITFDSAEFFRTNERFRELLKQG